MPRPVSESVVVLTGASSGIGRATARLFAASRAHVVAAARSESDLDSLARELDGTAGEVVAVPTDVTDPQQVHALAEQAVQRFGRIDTWVNAAAIQVYGRVEQIEDEEFDQVIRTNLLGQIYGARAALPHLRQSSGTLIGVGSVESYRAVPLQAPYVAAKHGLRGFYDSLRIELAEEGAAVAVVLVLPAGIDTPLFEHARNKLDKMPKPPPPAYSPDVVARAIVRAAESPSREVPVGGAAAGFIFGQRFAPALTDAFMTLGGALFRGQVADRPDNDRDNVDEPMSGTGQETGSHSGRTLAHSAYTRLVGLRRTPGELVTSALTTLRRRGGSDEADVYPSEKDQPAGKGAGVELTVQQGGAEYVVQREGDRLTVARRTGGELLGQEDVPLDSLPSEAQEALEQGAEPDDPRLRTALEGVVRAVADRGA